MMEWDVKFYSYSPPRGGFAILHDKMWVLDGSVLITGSVNPTANGFDNSEENMVIIRSPPAVQPAYERLVAIRGRAKEVTKEDLRKLVFNQQEKKRLARSKSVSAN